MSRTKARIKNFRLYTGNNFTPSHMLAIALVFGSIGGYTLLNSSAAPGDTANIWVDTNGGTCTRQATAGAYSDTAACADFDAAYQKASPGDVVLVKAGTYATQTIEDKPSATTPNIVIKEAPGERVIVGDAGEKTACVGFEGSTYVEVHGVETIYTTAIDGKQHQCSISIGRSNAHHVVLNGVDSGHVWVGANDVTVLNSDLGPGISGHGTGLGTASTSVANVDNDTGEHAKRILFEGNKIHSNHRIGSSHPQCSAPWFGQDITFRNNHFDNCQTFHWWNPASAEQLGARALGPYLIENNTFTQTDTGIYGCSGQQIKFGDHGGELKDIVFRNNHILTDCIGIEPALGKNGGIGNVTIINNEVGRLLSVNGTSCMGAQTTVQQGGATYTCGGNYMTGSTPPPSSDFYVATNGSDSNPGTSAQPWRTVQKALNTLTAGQSVTVRAGTYAEDLTYNRGLTNWITVQGEPGAIIDATSTHTLRVDSAGRFLRFKDFTILGAPIGSGGCIDIYGQDIEILENDISGCGDQGVYTDEASRRVLIARNRIHGVGGYRTESGQSNGVYLQGYDHTVESNLVYDNAYGHGLQIYDFDVNAKVINNTVVNSAHSGITMGGNTNAVVVGNIVYDNGTDGIHRSSQTNTSCSIHHNISFNNAADEYDSGWPSGCFGSNNLTVDPKFANYAARDLKLASDSPAINASDPNTYSQLAIDGVTRPQGAAPDMGAYEFASSSSSPKTGDLNNDNLVNIFDLSILLSNYGKAQSQSTNTKTDLNNDTNINIFDLSILLSNYGK